MDISTTLLFVFGRWILEARTSGKRNDDGMYNVSIGIDMTIPARVILFKIFGFFMIKAHRRGLFEGEIDVVYKGENYLLEYDIDYEMTISTKNKAGYELLKKAIKKTNIKRINPGLW